MSEPPLHPTQEELNAYSLGQLPQERAVAIDSHISECQPCCETIVGLSSDDTFVGLLQEARQLPVDQTQDHDNHAIKPSSSHGDIPPELAEHPRYEIVRLIGTGGMGDVYEAIHRKMERRVALKVINRALFQKAEAVNRFHREVKAAAQLSDPNVVTAFDADQAGDFHFMVMEYVDGVDLSQTVKDRGALPVAEACDYIRQAAIGLQHAHEQGMVHRDIKPHNLMVTADGTVKVLDFGLASLAPEVVSDAETVEARGDLTAAGAVMGTPDFISPEQAENARSSDIRSDIYSLGSTLYFLLSGRPPFHDGSVMAKLKSHATEKPVALESLRDDLPEELTSLVARMTAKAPDDRFQTPAEVAEALREFVETGKPKQAEEPQTENSKGFGKLLIGGTLLGIAALLIVLNWQESVASKLAKMKTPVALTSEPPENKIPVLLYTVEAEALDGHPAAICDIGNCRIAVVDQDISRTRGFSEGLTLVVSGSERTRQRAIDSSKGEYFTSIYNDGEAKCRFHNFNFTLTEKMIRFGTTGTFRDNPASPGMLIMVDADTGDVITQPMTPKSERVFLAGMHRESQPIRLQPESPTSSEHPATPSTSISKPELRITTKTASKGTAGLPNVHDWNLRGRDVGDLKVRLLLAQNGKANVVQEFDFEELPAEFTSKVRLEVRDPVGADHQRMVTAILYVESPVNSRSTSTNEDRGLSFTVEAPFSNRIDRADLAPIDPVQTKLLQAWSYWIGDMNHGTSMESMTEATADGKVTFLFVTLDWSPGAADKPGASAILESASRFELQGDFGGAAAAYLEAYRLDPKLISVKHLPAIKRAGRVGDLVEVFTDSSPDNAVATEPRVELHFVEPRPIEGVTEQAGIKFGKGGVKFGTGPDQLVYLHVKPALVLNPSQVTSIKMQPWSFAGNQLYSIDIELTDPARKKLAAVVEGMGNHMRHVTYKVDGVRRGGWQRYEINENHGGAPEICRAKTFSPLFDASKDKELARRIVNALTPERSTSSAPAPTTSVVKQLLKHTSTRAEGNKLLKQLWLTDRDSHYNLLTSKRDEVWIHVADPIFYLRSKLIPADIAREGSGWGRFKIEGVYQGSEEPGWGYPLSLRPLLNDKAALSNLAEEVEAAIEQHPHWKAGVAVLSYLEAETGNYERATELITQVLSDAETRPIPSDSAFIFGMALEGKNAELDRQVMRLYESSLRNRPARVFRASAIPKLARLHAKYGERPEARRVLNRLTDVDYDPRGSHVICTPGGHPQNHSRCTECHHGKSNLLDVVVMSNNLTDVGYPVDALISLARINASFSNAYGSDDAWAKRVFPDNPYLNIARGQSRFVPAKEEAEKAITPQAVLEALKSGVFSGRYMTKPAPADAEVSIDLMTSVRGVDGKPTLYSPAVEVLELAAKGDEVAIANVQIDQLLAEAFNKNPDNVEVGIAATAFAFLRNDLDSATDRVKQLQAITDYPESDGAAFWLVARHALKYEQTRIIGAVLAERALAAADKQREPGLKEAILRERSGIRAK